MPRSLLFSMLVIPNPKIKQVLYLNGDDISKSVILTDVRIHLIIVQRYSILAISMKHLGLPKCIVSKLTCFPKMDSGIRQNDNSYIHIIYDSL